MTHSINLDTLYQQLAYCNFAELRKAFICRSDGYFTKIHASLELELNEQRCIGDSAGREINSHLLPFLSGHVSFGHECNILRTELALDNFDVHRGKVYNNKNKIMLLMYFG